MEIKIDKSSRTPLYRQIMNQLIKQINEAILYEGDRLPSERTLANQLNINRSTIVRAYDELEAQGFVEKRASSGTYISSQSEETKENHLRQRIQYNDIRYQKNDYEQQIETLLLNKKYDVLDGYTGELPYRLIPNISLPNVNWQSFLSEEVSELGYLPLRKMIAQLVFNQYSHQPKSQELMLTAGGQQSLVLLIQALLKSGDTVAVEDPSFFNGISVLNAMSIKVIKIPVDQDGMCVSVLEKMVKKESVQLVLTNPNFQNPTGTSMSLTRRKKLIELCQMYRIPIIEDDVFGQLSFHSSTHYPLLKELAPQSVIYIGSLSKILGSRMQLGWIEAPKYVLDEVVKLRDEYETQLNIFPQVMASFALTNPNFSKKLSLLQETLKNRMNYFINALQTTLSEDIDFTLPKGGYYIWLTYKKRELTNEDWLLLLKAHVAVLPSFIMTESSQSCRVNVARLDERKIDLFVLKLQEITQQWNKQITE